MYRGSFYLSAPLKTSAAYMLVKQSGAHNMIVYYQGVPSLVQINGLVQEKCNSSALAMEFRFSCTNPLR